MKIGRRLGTFVMCLLIAFMTMGMTFAATPGISDGTEGMYHNYLVAATKNLDETDVEALSPYMDQELVAQLDTYTNPSDYLVAYGMLDTNFGDVLANYYK